MDLRANLENAPLDIASQLSELTIELPIMRELPTQSVVAEAVRALDAQFQERALNVSNDLFDLRAGPRSRIRMDLAPESIATVLNDQLLQISPALVDRIIDAFPERDRKDARTVLQIASQFASLEPLAEIPKELRAHETRNFLAATDCSLGDVVYYLASRKNLFESYSIFPTKAEHATALVLDERTIEKIRNDPELAKRVAAGELRIIIPEGYSLGITAISTPLPSEIFQKTRELLDRAREIQASSAEPLRLRAALKSALTTPLLDQLTAACEAHGYTADFQNCVSVLSPTQRAEVNSKQIAVQLNGKQGITAEVTAEVLKQIPETFRPLASELVTRTATPFSLRSLTLLSREVQNRVLALTDQKNIAPDEIGYYIANSMKSYSIAGLIHQRGSSIPVNQIVGYCATKEQLAKYKALVVLDDFAGSGDSMKASVDILHGVHRPALTIVAPLVSTATALAKYSALGNMVRDSADIAAVPGIVIPGHKSSGFYRGLDDKHRLISDELVGKGGYGNSSTSISFPYMSPDNNNGLWARNFADYFTLSHRAVHKVMWSVEPGRNITGLPEDLSKVMQEVSDLVKKAKKVPVATELALKLVELSKTHAAAKTIGMAPNNTATELERKATAVLADIAPKLRDIIRTEASDPSTPFPRLVELAQLSKALQLVVPNTRETENRKPTDSTDLIYIRNCIVGRLGSRAREIKAHLKDPDTSLGVAFEGVKALCRDITLARPCGALGPKAPQLTTLVTNLIGPIDDRTKQYFQAKLLAHPTADDKYEFYQLNSAFSDLRMFFTGGDSDNVPPTRLTEMDTRCSQAAELGGFYKRVLDENTGITSTLIRLSEIDQQLTHSKSFGPEIETRTKELALQVSNQLQEQAEKSTVETLSRLAPIELSSALTRCTRLLRFASPGQAGEPASAPYLNADTLKELDTIVRAALVKHTGQYIEKAKALATCKSIEELTTSQEEISNFISTVGSAHKSSFTLLVKNYQNGSLTGLRNVLGIAEQDYNAAENLNASRTTVRNVFRRVRSAFDYCGSELFQSLQKDLPSLEKAFYDGVSLVVAKGSLDRSIKSFQGGADCLYDVQTYFSEILNHRLTISGTEADGVFINSRRLVKEAAQAVSKEIKGIVRKVEQATLGESALDLSVEGIQKLGVRQLMRLDRRHMKYFGDDTKTTVSTCLAAFKERAETQVLRDLANIELSFEAKFSMRDRLRQSDRLIELEQACEKLELTEDAFARIQRVRGHHVVNLAELQALEPANISHVEAPKTLSGFFKELWSQLKQWI